MEANSKIIYIGDPMCSWCYGISDEMAQLKEHFEGNLDFELVMGGLRPYNQQKMVELKDFLTHHWNDVHKASGQPFNYSILDNTNISYDTEPPSRATVVIRSIAPKKEYAFFKAIQRLFYLENRNMHLADSYHGVLTDLDIEKSLFDQKFHSTEFKRAVKEDFQKSADMGVRSFPTVVLAHKGKFYKIVSGFATKETMIREIAEIIQ